MIIWTNTIVNNEENFIWFAIMSVVDYVDKILIWDTGSTDKTVKIIKEIKRIKKDKIIFKEVGSVDKYEFPKVRQQMLDQSDCDWILIVDGDEIWWEKSIKLIVDMIQNKGNKLDAIIVPFYNLVGDVYHYQEETAGQYHLADRKGHLTIRAINHKIPGLHLKGAYGQEGFFDENNIPIQQRDPKRLLYVGAPFLHLTHLNRSSKNWQNKFKYDLGVRFPRDFKYPEVLYESTTDNVPSPWRTRSRIYEIISASLVPYKKLWRRFRE